MNFIPLGLGILDPVNDLDIINAHAKALLDSKTIWSDFGVISLSKTDPYYGKVNIFKKH